MKFKIYLQTGKLFNHLQQILGKNVSHVFLYRQTQSTDFVEFHDSVAGGRLPESFAEASEFHKLKMKIFSPRSEAEFCG